MFEAGGIAAGKFEYQRSLGSGAYGTVLLFKHPHTLELVAVKEIKISHGAGDDYLKIQRELAVLRELSSKRNENLVKILESHEVHAHNKIHIVMEYCNGGDYDAYLQLMEKLSEATLRHFFKQLSSGLQTLNAEGILHRDLKPANIFLHMPDKAPVTLATDHRNIVLKIGDFGVSKKVTTGRWTHTMCGTLTYMAPEVLDNAAIRDDSTIPHKGKADLWSLGLILYTSLCGKKEIDTASSVLNTMVFGLPQIQALQNMHLQIEKQAASLSPKTGSDELRNFLCGLLQRDFRERISFEQFVRHPFLTSAETEPPPTALPENYSDRDWNQQESPQNKISDGISHAVFRNTISDLLNPSRSVSVHKHPFFDYQAVAKIYSGALADKSRIPDRWNAFGHTGKYKVRRAFYRWEYVFHGTIICEGVGTFIKENVKNPRRAFTEPFQQYLVHLCRNGLVDKDEMARALAGQQDLEESDKLDIITKIKADDPDEVDTKPSRNDEEKAISTARQLGDDFAYC